MIRRLIRIALALFVFFISACSSPAGRFSVIANDPSHIIALTGLGESSNPISGQTPAAAISDKPDKSVVLLPIQGVGFSPIDRDQYRSALAQGLSSRYQVFSGDDVDKKLEKFAKKTCDAEKCLQEMAIAYQTSLVGRAVLSREEDEYVITVEIRDAFTDQVEFTDTNSCSRCNKGQVISALKRVGRRIR